MWATGEHRAIDQLTEGRIPLDAASSNARESQPGAADRAMGHKVEQTPMSGIVGYWAYSSRDLCEAVFAAFTHSLAHRGPDGFGIEHFPKARLWLGHRRLAILDHSERSRQPISYGEGRYWLTYNGEVYNYLELREELRGLGHTLIADSDSEVILAAFAQWGPHCLLRFNGMWAFAIWDARDRRLFLSRDRFGLKPLFYRIHASAFSFASELKAFLALPGIDGGFDSDVLAQTLIDVVGQEASPGTLLPKVHRLPAGHWMQIENTGQVHLEAWWNTLDHLPQPPKGLSAQVDEFRSLLIDACRLRMLGHGPLAVEQSGGLDLSAIACTVTELGLGDHGKRASMDCQSAFVAYFNSISSDERKEASVVINHTGMKPSYEYIDDKIALENIERTIFDHEIIFSFPRVGSWVLFRAMRTAGIRASLNGGAADSLMGNDRTVVEHAVRAAVSRLDFRRYWELRQILRTYDIDDSASVPVQGEFRRLARRFLAQMRLLKPLRVVRDRLPLFRVEPIVRVAARSDSATSDTDAAYHYVMSPLEAANYRNFHVDNQLHYANFDRASMAHGIQVRMPFTDWRLVTFGFALPETSKYGCGYTKRILRLAMFGRMPDEIRLRTVKMPFISPMDNWARGALKPWLLDLCASTAFLDSSVWDGPAVKAAVERAVVGQASLWPVWPILNAYVLEQAFKQRARETPAEADRNPVN